MSGVAASVLWRQVIQICLMRCGCGVVLLLFERSLGINSLSCSALSPPSSTVYNRMSTRVALRGCSSRVPSVVCASVCACVRVSAPVLLMPAHVLWGLHACAEFAPQTPTTVLSGGMA
jgi:hypothetical protein